MKKEVRLHLFLLIKGRIVAIEIFGIQLILCDSKGFRKALIVYDLASAKEFDGIAHVGIVNQAQNIIVGCSCLLFCCILVSNLFRLHFPFNLDVKPF